jgi:ABC-type multidrug transport system fused ATPase/permease subunit
VYFAYSKKDGTPGSHVVKNVNLSIAPGEHIAIVGPSGSGKTTLMDLLRRGHDPEAGEICLDGIPLTRLALKDLYRNIAVVDQSSLMMDLSIRENIQLGAPEKLSDEEMLALCQLAGLDITKFEDGLDKHVGESGNAVSGGERQRIAIARALASNAPILIFDEPTSALDAILEAEIRSAIDKASIGRTTITIAHRLATVQHSDRIYLMEDGVITSSGTHAELLRTSGRYMELVEKQKILV